MKRPDSKRLFILLLLTALFGASLNGESIALPDNTDTGTKQISLGQRITGMASLMRDNYREKIYIQTDRPIYNLYDTIWYKVWVMQAGTLLPTEKSQLVYVDLINEVNSVTQSAQYTLKGGSANGQFVLTKAIQDIGVYRVRAYTRWQKNFGDSACFEKIIPIWGDQIEEKKAKRYVSVFLSQMQLENRKRKAEKKKHQVAEKKANREYKLDVQFLPEGGKLIAGVPNRVAYKALFPDGRSAPVEGTIVDQKGNDMVSFASEHKGMGSFVLLPDTGKQYSARLFNDQLIPLPPVEKEGVTLMVVSKPTADTLVVAVNASLGIVANQSQFTLIAESRGLPTKEAYNITTNKSRILLRIPKENLKSGINRLTLFTAEGKPLCERLVYIDRKDALTFDVKANWEIKSDTDQMMTLKIRPQLDGQSVAGSFAVSVTNVDLVPVDSIQKTFRSEMLLSSDLKGFIETPGYYFNNPYDSICKQLDLVLLTHGWRGYSWDDVTRKSFTHRPDTSFTLSGTVSNLLLKPSARRRVSLFVQGGKMIAKETKTDQNGKFFFKDLDIKETSMARINLEKDKRSRLGFGIELDTIHRKPYFPIVRLENYLYESEEMDSLLFTFRENQEENDSYLDSLRKTKGVHLLKEVTVTERKRIPNSYNTFHEPDMVIDSVQLGRYDAYTNVIEVLKAEVPGFKKDFGSQRDAKGTRVFRQYEYYNISGAPVIFIIDAEVINEISPWEPPKTPGAVAMHADRTEYAVMKRTDYLLEGLAGSDIRGIEVITTEDKPYYDRIIAFVYITTKKGQGPRDMVRSRTYFTEIRGGSIPKNFYVPKYYPKETIDQINYDGKHVYYWNPALLTNGEQDVEVSFPVGAYMKGNLQLEIEGTDLNGHIGTQRQEIKLNR